MRPFILRTALAAMLSLPLATICAASSAEIEGIAAPPPPDITIDGYRPVTQDAIGAAAMIGVRVYDRQDVWVGEISATLDCPAGGIAAVVIDVGGFLGIGERPVAMAIESLTILQDEISGDLKIYQGLTDAALDALPDYRPE